MTPLLAVCLLSLLSGINGQGGPPSGAGISGASPTGSTGIHHAGMYASGVPAPGFPASGTPMSRPGISGMSGMPSSYMSRGAPMSIGSFSSGGIPTGTYRVGGTSLGSMPAGSMVMPGVSMHGAGATSTRGAMSTHDIHGTGSTHGRPGLSYLPGGTLTSTGAGSHTPALGGGSPTYTAVGTSGVPSLAGGTHMSFGSGTPMGSSVIAPPMSGFGASTGVTHGFGMGLPGASHASFSARRPAFSHTGMGGPAFRTAGMTGVASRGIAAGRPGSSMQGAPRLTMIGGELGFPGRRVNILMGGAGAGALFADGAGPFGSGSSGMPGAGMHGHAPGMMMGGGMMMPGMFGHRMF